MERTQIYIENTLKMPWNANVAKLKILCGQDDSPLHRPQNDPHPAPRSAKIETLKTTTDQKKLGAE